LNILIHVLNKITTKLFNLPIMKVFNLLLGMTLLSSCSIMQQKTYELQLRNWNAASENVTNLSLLVEDDGVESCPAVLNNNLLLFESKKNNNSDLWYINLDKPAGLIQLTTYDGPDRLPAPHPDGKHYCFLSDRGETGIYLGEIGKQTAISMVETRQPTASGWASCDISPDGKIMIYVSGDYIWTFELNQKTKTQLIQGTQPKWSPNGKKVIFTKGSKIVGDYISSSVWIMNSDGTDQTELISGNTKYSYSGAKISPDGKKILYEKRAIKITGPKVTFEPPDIWICNIDATDHTQITTHPLADQEGVWLNDDVIIFCSDRPQSGSYKDRKWDIWKLSFVR